MNQGRQASQERKSSEMPVHVYLITHGMRRAPGGREVIAVDGTLAKTTGLTLYPVPGTLSPLT